MFKCLMLVLLVVCLINAQILTKADYLRCPDTIEAPKVEDSMEMYGVKVKYFDSQYTWSNSAIARVIIGLKMEIDSLKTELKKVK